MKINEREVEQIAYCIYQGRLRDNYPGDSKTDMWMAEKTWITLDYYRQLYPFMFVESISYGESQCCREDIIDHCSKLTCTIRLCSKCKKPI